MIFDFHGQPPHRWVIARSFRHGPALHHAVELQTEIEMQMTRGVLLHDELQLRLLLRSRALLLSRRCEEIARWLLGLREIALPPVFAELCPARAASASFLCGHCHSPHLSFAVTIRLTGAFFMPSGAAAFDSSPLHRAPGCGGASTPLHDSRGTPFACVSRTIARGSPAGVTSDRGPSCSPAPPAPPPRPFDPSSSRE